MHENSIGSGSWGISHVFGGHRMDDHVLLESITEIINDIMCACYLSDYSRMTDETYEKMDGMLSALFWKENRSETEELVLGFLMFSKVLLLHQELPRNSEMGASYMDEYLKISHLHDHSYMKRTCISALSSLVSGKEIMTDHVKDVVCTRLSQFMDKQEISELDKETYLYGLLTLVFLRSESLYKYVKTANSSLSEMADVAVRIDYGLDDEEGTELPFN